MMRVAALLAGEGLGFAIGNLSRAWPWILGATVGLFLVCYGWHRRIRPILWLFLAGFVLAARVNGSYRTALEERVVRRAAEPPATFTVEDSGRIRMTKKGERRCAFPSHLGAIPVHVVLPLPPDAPPPEPGEKWMCAGTLSYHTDSVRPAHRKTFWVRHAEDACRLEQQDAARPASRYARVRRRLSTDMGIGLSWCPHLADLNRAILLGERTAIPPGQRRTFELAGTLHVFAISGLHVVAVAHLLMRACALFGVSVRTQGLFVLPLLAAYVMATGARPSAVRAALMTACHVAAPLFGRKPDLLRAWTWTALVVYVVSPERLFDVGCTLSFAVMLGIAWWIAWRERLKPLVGEGSPFAETLARWGVPFRIRQCLAQTTNSLGVSLAAWIASTPIMAHVFNRITLAGLVANLAVATCSGLTVRYGLVGLLASGFCLPLAACANNLSAATTQLMILASEAAARLPFASFAATDWHMLYTPIWYAAWILFFTGLGRLLPSKRRIPSVWWKQ